MLVIFGVTGDLAGRMTFRALYRLERRGLLDCPVIGVANQDITTEQLVKDAREAILDSGQELDDEVAGRPGRTHVSGAALVFERPAPVFAAAAA